MSILKRSQKSKSIKVIILAAGSGRRLKMDLPKAMVEVNDGETIMDHQLNNLQTYFEIDDILVVVGYKKEILMEKYSNLTYVYNKHFDITNTAKSLQLALKKFQDYDVLWINGDVLFDTSIIQDVLDNREKNLICVNNSRVAEEEVKYKIDNSGNISEISKEVLDGLGEAVGINFIKKDSLDILIEKLEECGDMDYFEKGVETAILNNHLTFVPLNVGDRFCMEIDFPEDLKKARQ